LTRIIGILSGKGGVGKTTTAINLGASTLDFGREVIVVDGDLGTSNLALQLGLVHFPATIQDLLKGDVDLFHAIYIHESGLRIIPASISLRYLEAESEKLRDLFTRLNSMVFVDSPPGLDRQVLSIMEACDEALIVTNPNISAVTDALKTVSVARDMGKKITGVVVNRYEGGKFDLSLEEISEMFEEEILGVVPESKDVKKSQFLRTPLVKLSPLSPVSLAYKEIAAKILGVDYRKPRFAFLRRLVRF